MLVRTEQALQEGAQAPALFGLRHGSRLRLGRGICRRFFRDGGCRRGLVDQHRFLRLFFEQDSLDGRGRSIVLSQGFFGWSFLDGSFFDGSFLDGSFFDDRGFLRRGGSLAQQLAHDQAADGLRRHGLRCRGFFYGSLLYGGFFNDGGFLDSRGFFDDGSRCFRRLCRGRGFRRSFRGGDDLRRRRGRLFAHQLAHDHSSDGRGGQGLRRRLFFSGGFLDGSFLDGSFLDGSFLCRSFLCRSVMPFQHLAEQRGSCGVRSCLRLTGGGDAGRHIGFLVHSRDGLVDGGHVQLQRVCQLQGPGQAVQLLSGLAAGCPRFREQAPGLLQGTVDLRSRQFALRFYGLPQSGAVFVHLLQQGGGLFPPGGQGLLEFSVAQRIQAALLLAGVLPYLLDQVADAVVGDLALTQVGLAFLPVIQQLLIQIAGLLDDLGFYFLIELGGPAADPVVILSGLSQLPVQLVDTTGELLFAFAEPGQIGLGGPASVFQSGGGVFRCGQQVGLTLFRSRGGGFRFADGLLFSGSRVPGGLLQTVPALGLFLHPLGDQAEALLLFLQYARGFGQLALQLAHQTQGGIQGLFHDGFHVGQQTAAAGLHALTGGDGAVDHALGIGGGFAGPVQRLLQLADGGFGLGQPGLGLPEGFLILSQLTGGFSQPAVRFFPGLPGGVDPLPACFRQFLPLPGGCCGKLLHLAAFAVQLAAQIVFQGQTGLGVRADRCQLLGEAVQLPVQLAEALAVGDDVRAYLLQVGGELFDDLVVPGLVRFQLPDGLGLAPVVVDALSQPLPVFHDGGQTAGHAGPAFVQPQGQLLPAGFLPGQGQLVLADQLPQPGHGGGQTAGARFDLQPALLHPALAQGLTGALQLLLRLTGAVQQLLPGLAQQFAEPGILRLGTAQGLLHQGVQQLRRLGAVGFLHREQGNAVRGCFVVAEPVRGGPRGGESGLVQLAGPLLQLGQLLPELSQGLRGSPGGGGVAFPGGPVGSDLFAVGVV